jgi:hypothetical protein
MPVGGIIVEWECKGCGGRGTVLFAQGETVGRRLRECEESHRSQDPTCRLDWNNVVVTELELPDDFFKTNPRAS